MSNKAYLLGKVAFVSTYAIILSVSTNIFMPVNAVASAVDNTNSITLQNSAAVPSVKASDYAAAQAAKEKSEAPAIAAYEVQKAEFAKANKITVAILNDELTGKTKNPKYLDAFETFITTSKLNAAKARMNFLMTKQTKGLTKSESSELQEIQYGFRDTLSGSASTKAGTMSASSFGPSRVQPFNLLYDIRTTTDGTAQVSAFPCLFQGYQIPAPYEPGDILVTRAGQPLPISNSGHAGIIVSQTETVEATGFGTVTRILPLKDWCKKSVMTTVGYVRGADKARAVRAATSWMLNRSYPDLLKMLTILKDDWFRRDMWDISTEYCSKLVWRIYVDQGKDLGSTQALNMITPFDLFRDNDTLFNFSWATAWR